MPQSLTELYPIWRINAIVFILFSLISSLIARLEFRDVPDTTLPDTGFNRIVIYRIPDSSKHKHKILNDYYGTVNSGGEHRTSKPKVAGSNPSRAK